MRERGDFFFSSARERKFSARQNNEIQESPQIKTEQTNCNEEMTDSTTGVGALNPAVSAEFAGLKQHGKITAEYIWIGGSGEDLRSKTMVLDAAPASVADLREWNYDGSSTGQAPGHDSEVLIKPAAIFRDPFRGGDNILVMCSTFRPNGSPVAGLPAEGGLGGNNNRETALAVFENPKVCASTVEHFFSLPLYWRGVGGVGFFFPLNFFFLFFFSFFFFFLGRSRSRSRGLGWSRSTRCFSGTK